MNEKPLSLLDLGDGIKVIVITGGPCGGKSSGLTQLSYTLADRGYKVLVSPESATKLITAGMTPGELPWMEFQEEILLDTLAQEDRLFSIAKRYRNNGHKVVVLCDRGAMDGEAYIGAEKFSGLLAGLGFSHRGLCDERYHAAIHLRTAALGAEKFYTLANNAARKETPEEARALDERTLCAWMRHQHPRVIDNSTGFEDKLHRLLREVCAILGDPVPLEQEDKFLIEPPNLSTMPVKWVESRICQDYLADIGTGEIRRVRARSDQTNTSFYYTTKRNISPGVCAEEEKIIGEREYNALLTLRDPKKLTIKKKRICFFWMEQFFEVDLFEEPRRGLALMEAERSDRTPELHLPPFIKVIRNVTGEKEFANAQIAEYRRSFVSV